ncbi:MAG: tRNA (guanine(46)-N(7))-methyltransferase TrmB [Sneathiella sp.]
MPNPEDARKRVLYGRRRGKALRKSQQLAVDEFLPKIRVPEDESPLDLNTLFDGKQKEFWLEIGFGAGEHLVWQAENNPNVGIIGCEPFLNGVSSLIIKLQKSGATNVRIHDEAAEILMENIPEASLKKGFLLFADPWPKSNHHKRRFVKNDNISALAHILCDNAELRIATDHVDYGAWILFHMLQSKDFIWEATRPDDWRIRGSDWPQTRYEAKALREGRKSAYYKFRRLPRTA